MKHIPALKISWGVRQRRWWWKQTEGVLRALTWRTSDPNRSLISICNFQLLPCASSHLSILPSRLSLTFFSLHYCNPSPPHSLFLGLLITSYLLSTNSLCHLFPLQSLLFTFPLSWLSPFGFLWSLLFSHLTSVPASEFLSCLFCCLSVSFSYFWLAGRWSVQFNIVGGIMALFMAIELNQDSLSNATHEQTKVHRTSDLHDPHNNAEPFPHQITHLQSQLVSFLPNCWTLGQMIWHLVNVCRLWLKLSTFRTRKIPWKLTWSHAGHQILHYNYAVGIGHPVLVIYYLFLKCYMCLLSVCL